MKFAEVIKIHDQNDEINNPQNLSETIYEGLIQKHQTIVSQIVIILHLLPLLNISVS